ncbi:branched-chain amino acid transport system ATP-binding protein [Acetoanaerobium pronyense]|uniref:Branched-chain amino acid transport system ATP-binding protein n=1 Tax=Acetoanaerobium pronyense TaxID=1482736 RepID=A0ABS4KI63_9FIRM|nr:ABC transporter ATP-binding protein [Acetoanaerobium pronyense]MBP2027478.1 branched-chain amino acid transport system ATP-binding protein [Acetoanaerobium pronyense]
MLDIKDLNVYYSGIHALKGINLKVKENSIVSLIGANGAGKSTTLKAIMNMTKYNGNIDFSGKKLSSMKTKDIVKEGFTLVPEGRRVFSNLTVYENLLLGAYSRKDKEIQKDINSIYEIFPRLKERKEQKGGTMSGGEQQMLAIGRALMSRPKLLMMDEPSLGLAPLIVKDIFNIIKDIHSEGVTILLIEQNAKAALEIADYGYVLETGNIVLEGEGKALLHDERVKSAYLGEESI